MRQKLLAERTLAFAEQDPCSTELEPVVEAYTSKVRDVVVRVKAPVSSVEIRAKVGGNASRCRSALARACQISCV